jgi:regulatory protein
MSAKKMVKTPLEACRDKACRLLETRQHSVAELRRKLQRTQPPEAIEAAIAELLAMGLLNDSSFARAYAEWRFQGMGASRIRQELRRRGVADEVVADTLAEFRELHADTGAELERMRELAARKWRGIRDLSDLRKAQAKVARFLAARGFPSDAIWKVIGELKQKQ